MLRCSGWQQHSPLPLGRDEFVVVLGGRGMQIRPLQVVRDGVDGESSKPEQDLADGPAGRLMVHGDHGQDPAWARGR